LYDTVLSPKEYHPAVFENVPEYKAQYISKEVSKVKERATDQRPYKEKHTSALADFRSLKDFGNLGR